MAGPSPTPARIVVVDDNPADVYLIEEALRAHNIGFHMTHFEDGEQAVRALCAPCSEKDKLVPDLILLDLNLPRAEGLEVLQKIRETERLALVPVAILTASQSPKDRQQVTDSGSARFVLKPTDLNDFLREVGGAAKELLGRKGQ